MKLSRQWETKPALVVSLMSDRRWASWDSSALLLVVSLVRVVLFSRCKLVFSACPGSLLFPSFIIMISLISGHQPGIRALYSQSSFLSRSSVNKINYMQTGKTPVSDSPRCAFFLHPGVAHFARSRTGRLQPQAHTRCSAVRVGEVMQLGFMELDNRLVWNHHGGTILTVILAGHDSFEELARIVNLPAKQSGQ